MRQGQTDPAIMFTILEMMRSWILTPRDKQQRLTAKELLVLLQRVAQVERLQAIPLALKALWDVKFLDLLYTVITTRLVRSKAAECLLSKPHLRRYCAGVCRRTTLGTKFSSASNERFAVACKATTRLRARSSLSCTQIACSAISSTGCAT